MALSIAIDYNIVRADWTILPVLTVADILEQGWIQIDDWQYFRVGLLDSFPFIPFNRTKKEVNVRLKDCFYPLAAWTLDAGMTENTDGSITRTSGEGYNGGYYNTALSQSNCSIQAKATSTALSTGISLQDASETIAHNYEVATVRHSITLGQDGRGTIRENGVFASNNAFFKYETGDTVMIEVKDGICRYYLIKPDDTMKLLRQTRSKLTEDAKAEFLLYFTDSALEEIFLFDDAEDSTVYESIGVCHFRDDLGELYWQQWGNQRTTQSIGEQVEMADKRVEITYANQKKRLAAYSLTPKAQNIAQYWKFQDFVNWHDAAKEFIFIDYARKDLDGNPIEIWAKFSSGFADATRNGCQFEQSVAILEDFRNDYIPRIEDTTPPVVAITSVTEGSAVIVGTASDNVLLSSLQLYVNGARYGATFLPDVNGDWEVTVLSDDLIGGINSFYVVATDYAGNTTQSNTETLDIPIPDTEPPTVPTFFAINESSPATDTTVSFNWTGSTDNVAVEEYQIQYATDSAFTTGLGTQNFAYPAESGTVTGLTPETTYWFRIRAKDTSDNYSAYTTNEVTGTTEPISLFPSTLASLLHWYRAKSITDGTNGNDYAVWEDLKNAADTSSANPPKYYSNSGNPYLDFDGVNDYLAAVLTSLTGDYSIVVIFEWVSNSSDYTRVLGYGNIGAGLEVFSIGSTLYHYVSGNGISGTMPARPTGFMAVYLQRQGSSAKLRINGTETTGAIPTSATGTNVDFGAANDESLSANVRIKEIIICGDDLTGGDFTSLATYINDEHGLTL